MTKQQIVRMHNRLADTLVEIQQALTDAIKVQGGAWTTGEHVDQSGMVHLRYRYQELKFSTTQWFIDNVTQGTITTEADIWPQCMSFYNATTINNINPVWARVFYS